MPLTIITLRNTTPSLRGDLSKWMQEIATGVYIGNFNSRVRELLWQRVIENVGNGEATVSYATRNELGYNFKTHNTKRQIIDSDGIPLVMFPNTKGSEEESQNEIGFSNASKFRKIRKFSNQPVSKHEPTSDYVVVDIETDGLDETISCILEIGAVKITSDKIEEFQKMIRHDRSLPDSTVKLTGITTELLDNEGYDLSTTLEEFMEFVGDRIIVGYNINFDMKFINFSLQQCGLPSMNNRTIDLVPLVKKEMMFLPDYKLGTALEAYGIKGKVKHRALEDAKQTYELSSKLKKFEHLLKM